MASEDYRLAAAVARYVQLLDLRLSSVTSELLGDSASIGPLSPISFASKTDYAFDEDDKVLNVFIDFIARVAPEGGDVDDDERLAWGLRCSFELAYSFNVQGAPEGEELERHFTAFSKVNGVYNAWPYLRELVQSTANRMGIAVRVPVYRVRDQSDAASSKTDSDTGE